MYRVMHRQLNLNEKKSPIIIIIIIIHIDLHGTCRKLKSIKNIYVLETRIKNMYICTV